MLWGKNRFPDSATVWRAVIETTGRISPNNKHPNRILLCWIIGIMHFGERTKKVLGLKPRTPMVYL
jgi:hypothetical protein